MIYRNQGGTYYQVPQNTHTNRIPIAIANKTSNSDGFSRPNVQSTPPNLFHSQNPPQPPQGNYYVSTKYGKEQSHVDPHQTKTEKDQNTRSIQGGQTSQPSRGKKFIIGALILLLIAGGVLGTLYYLKNKSNETHQVKSTNVNLEDGKQTSTTTLDAKPTNQQEPLGKVVLPQPIPLESLQLKSQTTKVVPQALIAPTQPLASQPDKKNLKGQAQELKNTVQQFIKSLETKATNQLSQLTGQKSTTLTPATSGQVITFKSVENVPQTMTQNVNTPTTSVTTQTPTTRPESTQNKQTTVESVNKTPDTVQPEIVPALSNSQTLKLQTK